ncbi:hypothetical protein U5640_36305 [Streptomyces sp. SS7]|uniref:hypothetical protein n=1 Tax=Streptomyces sp. SS7 TaxID=3108485 RepID=UPI0030ED665A
MSQQPHPEPPRPAAPEPPKNNPKQVAIGCVIILALIAGVIGIAVAMMDSSNGGDGKPGDHAAAIICEDFVKQRLKSPSTADFPGVTDADYAKTTTLSDTKPWKYKVTGVVDSQNGFGAIVRSAYVCTVSTKDNDTWTLNDLDMTQR